MTLDVSHLTFEKRVTPLSSAKFAVFRNNRGYLVRGKQGIFGKCKEYAILPNVKCEMSNVIRQIHLSNDRMTQLPDRLGPLVVRSSGQLNLTYDTGRLTFDILKRRHSTEFRNVRSDAP